VTPVCIGLRPPQSVVDPPECPLKLPRFEFGRGTRATPAHPEQSAVGLLPDDPTRFAARNGGGSRRSFSCDGLPLRACPTGCAPAQGLCRRLATHHTRLRQGEGCSA